MEGKIGYEASPRMRSRFNAYKCIAICKLLTQKTLKIMSDSTELSTLPAPKRLIARRVRIYHGDFPKIWTAMQRIYARDDRDTAGMTHARRALFRNSLFSTLAQIEFMPERRD